MPEEKKRLEFLMIDDLDTLRLVTDPLRFQIMQVLEQEPQTVNQVAKKLGHSASRLYYHFKLLEEHGVIEVKRTRTVNNIIEKFYWLTAEDIKVNQDLINFSTDSGAENIVRMVNASVDAVRQDMLRSLNARKFNLAHGGKAQERDMTIFQTKRRLKDSTYQAFKEKLNDLIKAFSELPEAEEDSEDSSVYSFVSFAYPSYYYDDNDENRKEKNE